MLAHRFADLSDHAAFNMFRSTPSLTPSLSPFVAPNVILSAAHCAPSNVNRVRANINQYNLFNPGENGQNDETIQVTSFRTHPNYDQGTALANDFMLLKLATPSTNPVVKLNTDESFPKTNDPELTVLGWGTTLQGINQAPNVLQDVEVSYISNNQCRSTYGFSSVSESMLCCREAGQGACQGDSGGPLIIAGSGGDGSDDVQVGIVSWGYDCALANYPGKTLLLSEWVGHCHCTHVSWCQNVSLTLLISPCYNTNRRLQSCQLRMAVDSTERMRND